MGLYQPTVITPSSLNGTGIIDATKDMTISWYINGTIPILGWRFVIMENTVESTVLYTGEWRHEYIDPTAVPPLPKEVYGRDKSGNLIPRTDVISSSDLISAGIVNNYQNGYKLRIDQQYMVYEHPNTSNIGTLKVLTQISPSFFIAMESTTFSTSSWRSVYGRFAYFSKFVNWTSTSIPHSEFDPLLYNRWRLAEAIDPDNHVIDDTGNIYLANDEEWMYGILQNGGNYAVRLNGQLESGLELDTGWHEFHCEWTDTSLDYVHLRAYYVRNQPCICVRLEVDEGYDMSVITSPAAYRGWEIYRIRTDTGEMEKAGVIPRGETLMYDYGARNNTEYWYKAFYGMGAQDGYSYISNSIKMEKYWDWAVLECEKKSASYAAIDITHRYTNEMYHVKRVFRFQGNIESGSVTNDNKPNVQDNFTPYPTVQKSSRKGLSGTLKAWVGRVTNGVFSDSIEEINKIMDMSTSETIKFLRDRKGNIRMIEIGDPIRKETQDPYAEQPVAIELPWVEVGDANVQIVSLISDGTITRGDDIIDTDTAELTNLPGYVGYIGWTIEDEYMGSTISMDQSGNLVQTYEDDLQYAPATLEIVDGDLKVTTVVAADE